MPRMSAFDKQQQHQNKRQAIIREAAIAFNENGYEGTSLDTIATRLGVTKKALYYYVKNKQEILYEIFCQWHDAQSTAIEYAATHAQTGIEKLRVYAEKYVVTILQDFTPMDRMIGELSALDETRLQAILKNRKVNDKKVLSFVMQAIDEGHAAELDPTMIVHTLNGALDWIFKWYHREGPLTAAEVANNIFQVILKGLEKR